jgi:hypothetical protein
MEEPTDRQFADRSRSHEEQTELLMTCVHLRQLYKLCEEHDLKLSGTDLIRVVCNQCGEQEVCPSMLTSEYEALAAKHLNDAAEATSVTPPRTAGPDTSPER